MHDPFAHCKQLVRETDKDRFLATLFAPANRRGSLFALYAFNSEVARVRDAIDNAMAGEIRLQWWRDALERPGAAEARANPVAAAMLDTVVRYRLPLPAISDLIDARTFDLYDDPMPTLAALEAYVEKTSSALIALASRILDPARENPAASRAAGIAYAIAGLLRVFPFHAARGQLYLPLDIMQRHGVEPADIFAGRATPALAAALAEMRRIAHDHFAAYRASGPVAPTVAPAFLPAELAPLYLQRLAKGRDPFKLSDLPQWRRQWALGRAGRRM
jgi:phytoene synthase